MLLGLSFETQGEGVRYVVWHECTVRRFTADVTTKSNCGIQEEKMKTVIQNAWDENLKLHALKRVKTQGKVETSAVTGPRAT